MNNSTLRAFCEYRPRSETTEVFEAMQKQKEEMQAVEVFTAEAYKTKLWFLLLTCHWFLQYSQAVLFFMLEALVFSLQRAHLHVSMADKTFNSFVFLFPPTSALFSRAYLQPGYKCGWKDICKAFIDESVILCLNLSFVPTSLSFLHLSVQAWYLIILK